MLQKYSLPESQNSASVLLIKLRKSFSILGLSNNGDNDLHVLIKGVRWSKYSTQIEKQLLIKQKKNSKSCIHSHYNLFTENVPKRFDNSLSHLNIW